MYTLGIHFAISGLGILALILFIVLFQALTIRLYGTCWVVPGNMFAILIHSITLIVLSWFPYHLHTLLVLVLIHMATIPCKPAYKTLF